jgi:phage tail-like protein
MAGTRSYVAGNFLFNLDGVKCGFVRSVDGGGISADVVEEKGKPGSVTKKHIGQPKYEDIELTIGFAMAQTIYDWIAASWKQSYARKDGSIVATDATFQARSERQFFKALITEVTFPALDGSSKDAAYLAVKLSPEYTREAKASGKVTPEKTPAQKQFVASSFRLELDGVDCTKVSKIDSFTVKQSVVADDIGDARDMQKEPGTLEFPNLRVTIAETGAATWTAWFEDFVIKGNNDDAHEKSGAIVFLAPNRKDELGRVILHNVGIFGLRREAATSASDKISRVVADLYCEQMELQIGKPVVEKPAPLPRRPVPLPR